MVYPLIRLEILSPLLSPSTHVRPFPIHPQFRYVLPNSFDSSHFLNGFCSFFLMLQSTNNFFTCMLQFVVLLVVFVFSLYTYMSFLMSDSFIYEFLLIFDLSLFLGYCLTKFLFMFD